MKKGRISVLRYNPKKHRLPECKACGVLPVNKPATWTSFDVVNFVRARFNVPKVGHCGTLDPMATGLLLLVLGRFTSLSGRLSGVDKQYTGSLMLGVETDSGDLDGKVIQRSEVTASAGEVEAAFASFRGKSLQLPPMYSAVKVGGKKLYDLARQGVEIEREAREITVSRLEITNLSLPDVDFTVDCSKGTYIRTLAADIGKKLGCGGVLTALHRTRCGKFSIDDAVTVDELKEMDQDRFTSMMADRLVKLSEGITL
ncbi:MAG: tRNA pseudouridine(55) synthase TruB [Lentisphaerae bacterium]|nr:tRNA pseudouridine(55) synthase TruB [Lentisphaerota bacterium]